MTLGRDFTPPGPVIRRFLEDRASRVKVLMGPLGSGKSSACVVDLLMRAAQQPPGPDGRRRTRFAVIRNSYPELRTTTIRTWTEWVGGQGKLTLDAPARWELVAGDLEVEVLVLALDRPEDVKKLLSLELTAAWINEAREIRPEIFDGLTGRVGRFPSKAAGGAERVSGIVLDTNPPSEDSWLARLMTEDKPASWAVYIQPSGLSPQAENKANLPANYYDMISEGKSETWKQVYVAGKFGTLTSGKPVFPEFSRRLHLAEKILAPLPGLPVRIGVDFGLTPACVFGQRTNDGRWHIIAELVTDSDEQMGAQQFGERVREAVADWFDFAHDLWCWGDPAGRQQAQTDQRAAMQVFSEAAGIRCRPAPTNSFTERREAVAAVLSRNVNGEPAFRISPACEVLTRALAGAYCFRRVHTASGPQDLPQADKGFYSHISDALQYLIAGTDSEAARRRRQHVGPVQERTERYDPLGAW